MPYKNTPDNRLEGYVRNADFATAYSILTANTVETPVDLEVSSNSLVGRLSGNIAALTGTQAAGIIPHNSLSGLQGGGGGEYYHLTAAQVAALDPTLDVCYNNASGASLVTVDAGDVTFAIDGEYSFNISLVDADNAVDGFHVENGADYVRVNRLAADALSLETELNVVDINVSSAIEIDVGGAFSIDGGGASNVSVTAGNLTLSTITSGTLAVASAGALTIDSAAAFSIDGVGNSNLSATSGNLTVSTITGGILSVASAGELHLSSASLMTFADGYKAGSTYSSDFVLTDSAAEWSTFDTNFGEVSLFNALNQCRAAVITDHGSLGGLTDDDHVGYARLSGRSGGQTLIGGTDTTDDLVLRATSGVGASGSDIIFQVGNNGATEAARILYDGRVGIGTATPTDKLSIRDNSTTGVPSLGSELLTNGAFTSDLSSWTAGANWAWNAGTAKHTAGATATIYQGIVTTANEHYYVEVVVTGRTAGSVVMTLQNSTESFTLSSNTTYKYSFKAGTTATNNLIFTPSNDFDGAIDSVIAKVVVPASTYALALYDSGGAITNLCATAIDDSFFGISIGQYSCANHIYGTSFVSIGKYAGWSNTVGSDWCAIGNSAGASNTTGGYWFALGTYAGYSSVTGNSWTAIGYYSGRLNSSGNYWLSVGSEAAFSNTTGSSFCSIGYGSSRANISGSNWVSAGANSGRFISGGGNNTTCTDFVCIGYDTRLGADGTTNEIVIGTQAIGVGSNSVVLGNSSITKTILRGNTAIGTTNLDGTPAIGRLVVKGSTNDGSTNCFVLRDSDETNVFWIDTDGDLHTDQWLENNANTFIGVGVCGAGNLAHTTGAEGYRNTAFGANNLYAITTGKSNTAVGYEALLSNTTADFNTAIGNWASRSGTTGAYNTAIGSSSLYNNNTGSYNVSIGEYSMRYMIGSYNTCIGGEAGSGVSTASAVANNTCIGYQAGFGLITGGDNNTLIGYKAGDNITTGASNIIIGASCDAPSATGSNQLNIGNTIYGDLSSAYVGIGTYDFDGTPAIGRLVVKGSTNDGSTNCLVLRDSDEANVIYFDTNGLGYFADKIGISSALFGSYTATKLLIEGASNDASTDILTCADSDHYFVAGIDTNGKGRFLGGLSVTSAVAAFNAVTIDKTSDGKHIYLTGNANSASAVFGFYSDISNGGAGDAYPLRLLAGTDYFDVSTPGTNQLDCRAVLYDLNLEASNSVSITQTGAFTIEHDGTDFSETISDGNKVTVYEEGIVLADDASFDLPTASWGWIEISVECDSHAETKPRYALFTWSISGVVNLVTTNTATYFDDADTDGTYCVFDNGTNARVRNRLGSSRRAIVKIHYSTATS